MFHLNKTKKNTREGLLYTKSGVIHTPFFMPIATKGAVKNVPPEDLRAVGAEIILGNTYHLWLRPGDDIIAEAGGLAKFMNWNGPILTDSGGYQVFSLGARAEKKFGSNGVKLSEKGVEFVDPVDGKRHFMSPEKSIDIQLNLGSDIIMVLDECPPYPCSYEQAKKSLELTMRWAQRCKKHFEKRINSLCHSERSDPLRQVEDEARESRDSCATAKALCDTRSAALRNDRKVKRPLLFGIVQGSVYEDLRKECAKKLVEMNFDGYAIGGVAVGEPRKHLYEILDWVVPLLPEEKPRYLMGLGKPEEIASAIESGIDMFDCVIPTREGRHGRLFVARDEGEKEFYRTICISNEKFKHDFSPIDKNCCCYTCQNYSKAYLNHLLRTNEPLFLKLASIHNLFFYLQLMRKYQGKNI